MAKRQIKFSLLYRDMWQSSGKYVPRVDQLKKIAPVIIDMGCFARIETNGGAFEQVCLLFGENPNQTVPEWTKPFNEAGIQTHMLERALNGIRMFPVPADVRKLMYRVKKEQGVDIARSFCGLNDPRNLELSIRGAKQAGMISQAALSITHSPVHTVEYYMNVVDKAVEFGTDEIALKDMSGVGRPVLLGRLVRAIKENYPHLPVQYHGHSGPGFSVASMLEVAKAGADILDVAMEPLSWGMVHPDVITIQEMLKDAGFDVPEINMHAYMEARALNQSFMDDFLGYFIDPKNRYVSSLMIQSGLPGGMMGSLMADLKGVHTAINMALREHHKNELTEDELLVNLFEETAFVWPKLGYPPLVTPFSQYVKNVALLNIVQQAKGEERYSMMDENTWSMILGKAGKLPGPLAPEILRLAEKKGKEFYSGTPQDLYPDALEKYRAEMKQLGWDTGKNDEELFEFAMHETQYRDYKSGLAKKRFLEEIEKIKSQSEPRKITTAVKDKQAPSRTGYSKEPVDLPVALAGFLAYTLNSRLIPSESVRTNGDSVWTSIGFWRSHMTVTILHDKTGIPVKIKVPSNGNYEFQINDCNYRVKLLHIGLGEVDFSVNDQSYFAGITATEGDYSRVIINQKEFLLMRTDLLADESLAHTSASAAGSSENRIIAPIPGRIFRINVKEGDTIGKGEVVLVIDAMKMENNILSKREGTVKKILVKLDDMVEAGARLIEME
ncbi:MAG TPA: oxaloacetate decarboxylase [Bacteroidales bacterium]|nr:oxaloacetate decarboxylase [Bacteroidales bacterium]HNS46605.1 oxaloacetate decarboxylase [Bacteroidales bacterium]